MQCLASDFVSCNALLACFYRVTDCIKKKKDFDGYRQHITDAADRAYEQYFHLSIYCLKWWLIMNSLV